MQSILNTEYKEGTRRKMKKIVKILLISIIAVGIICMAIFKFNIGLEYGKNVQLGINIGTEFSLEDVKSIAKEVFGTKNISVKYIELYKDMVKITVADATDEQIETLNNKINEKYQIQNEVSSIEVTRNEKVDLKSVIKPLIIPVVATAIITIIYSMIVFKKLGTFKVLYKVALALVGSQMLLMSIYAITRLPINNITPVISIVVYVVTTVVTMTLLEKEEETLKEQK